MTSCIIVVFSAREVVCAFMVQLFPFHASVVEPSHEMPDTDPSVLDPSHLQTGRDFVMTIQLP